MGQVSDQYALRIKDAILQLKAATAKQLDKMRELSLKYKMDCHEDDTYYDP